MGGGKGGGKGGRKGGGEGRVAAVNTGDGLRRVVYAQVRKRVVRACGRGRSR